MPVQKKKPGLRCGRALNFLKDLFTYQMNMQSKFGKSSFALPVWLVVLLIIPFSHFVLIALIVALIAGYRISFDRNR